MLIPQRFEDSRGRLYCVKVLIRDRATAICLIELVFGLGGDAWEYQLWLEPKMSLNEEILVEREEEALARLLSEFCKKPPQMQWLHSATHGALWIAADNGVHPPVGSDD